MFIDMRSTSLAVIGELVVSLAFHLTGVSGLQMGVQVIRHSARVSQGRQLDALSENLSVTGTSTTLTSNQDLSYITTIGLNGVSVPVLVDTGSSDLWVSVPVANSTGTGQTAELSYASGHVSGSIEMAKLRIGDKEINDQAYLAVDRMLDIDNRSTHGFIGLGPSSGSTIKRELDSTSHTGYQPLDRLFAQNATEPFFTILLEREHESESGVRGSITIGEVLPGMENITVQPKLEIDRRTPHWAASADALIGPNGTHLAIPNEISAVFDSGFTVSQIPPSMAQQLYAQVPGSEIRDIQGLGLTWTVPCTSNIEMAFILGGVTFPIHPLDTNLDNIITNGNGPSICIGGFQSIDHELEKQGTHMILGMSFLRNAYFLVNYGQNDFVPAANATIDTPVTKGFIQLLPLTTDLDAAREEFRKRNSQDDGIRTRNIVLAAVLPVVAIACCVGGYVLWKRSRRRQQLHPSFNPYQAGVRYV